MVDAAEIEKGHIEIHGGAQVFQSLAESQAQPRKAAQMRPYAQVGALDMACADMLQLRHSANWDRHCRFDGDGVVPFGASNIWSTVNLDELREVNVRAVGFFNRGDVPLESQAIEVFRQRERDGEPCIVSPKVLESSATQN